MIKEGILFPSITYKKMSACGNLYITFARQADSEDLLWINVSMGKAGGCAAAVMKDMNAMFEGLLKLTRSQQIEIINKAKGNVCQFQRQSCRFILMNTVYNEVINSPKKEEK